jgi:hypothetical protein
MPLKSDGTVLNLKKALTTPNELKLKNDLKCLKLWFRCARSLFVNWIEFLNPGPDLDIKIDKRFLPLAKIIVYLKLNPKRQGGL